MSLAERAFALLGFVALAYYAIVSMEEVAYESYENRALEQILTTDRRDDPRAVPSTDVPAASPAVRRSGGVNSLLGRMEIGRLGVSAVVREGDDARTLRLAVGHIPGTPLPGEPGNVGLAGHRDTFFRRLKHVRRGDEIRLTTARGSFLYKVEATRVVQPDAVDVLDDTAVPSLTLVTCYPFSFIGSAPQRFIVRAVRN